MNKFLTVCFCVLIAASAFAQKQIVPLLETESRPILKYKHELKIGGLGEAIIAKKFLYDEDLLLTVTNAGIQYWNVKTGERVRSAPHESEELAKIDSVFAISPDGKKMIVADGFNMSLSKLWGKKAKMPAYVYDLRTGQLTATLQRPDKSIRRVVWTADGKTLVTFSATLAQGYDTEVCFWNAETLELRGSITANGWNHLTRAGDKFITTSGVTKNTFGYKFEKSNAVNIWDVATGKIEKTYVLDKKKPLKNIRITADERFLLSENDRHIILLDLATGRQQNFRARDNSSVDSARLSGDKRFLAAENNGKILVWENGAGELPKFEILPSPPVEKEKRTTDIRGFSFDGKRLAVWQMRYKKALLFLKFPSIDKTEYYDLETGLIDPEEKLFIGRDSAGALSGDGRYAVTSQCDRASFVGLDEMRELYLIPLKCKSGTTTNYDAATGETSTETYYYNDDIIAFHPQKNVALIVKDEVLELYGTNPEQKRLQIIDAPRMLDKKHVAGIFGNSIDDLFAGVGNLVDGFNVDADYSSAGFLKNGDMVYAVSADRRSIFFWEVDRDLME